MLAPLQGQCRGYCSGSVLGNPFFEAAGGKTPVLTDSEGKG